MDDSPVLKLQDGTHFHAAVLARRGFDARVLELVADDPILLAVTEPMLRVRQALLEEFERLDRLCQQLARRDPVCRRLMTVPGVGVVVALTYRTGVDAPERFSKSRDVGAHFGLTPKRYSSGQTDYDGRISRCGDEMVRTALYQAANVLLHHGRWSIAPILGHADREERQRERGEGRPRTPARRGHAPDVDRRN